MMRGGSPHESEEDRLIDLSTRAARAVVQEMFVEPVRKLFADGDQPIPRVATDIYAALGRGWVSTLVRLKELGSEEAHVCLEGSSLEQDLEDIVNVVLEKAWATHSPKFIPPGTHVVRGLARKVSVIRRAYARTAEASGVATKLPGAPTPAPLVSVDSGNASAYAQAQALQAVSNALTTVTARLGSLEQLVGAGPTTANSGPAAAKAPESLFKEAASPPDAKDGIDLLDLLAGRMNATETPKPADQLGNQGVGAQGAPRENVALGSVSPALARAASRLVAIGVTPLRVAKHCPALSAHMLTNEETFSRWVQSKKLSGAGLREALTLGRALDLAVGQYGPGFLASDPAEVMVRRLLSLALSSKTGSFKMAGVLEEVPGEGALVELPDEFMKSMSERMKLEAKLEDLMEAKGGGKKKE